MNFLTDFIPKHCLLCDTLLPTDTHVEGVCDDCWDELLHWRYASYSVRCPVCGNSCLQAEIPCHECGSQLSVGHKEHDIRTVCCGPYRGSGKVLLIRYKFHARRRLASVIASLLLLELRILYPDTPLLLIPVPSGKTNRRKRGWDQILLVCRHLEKVNGIKVLPILKKADDREQKLLNREERLLRKDSRFALKRNGRDILISSLSGTSDCRLVIVDDVFTTGATVEGCRRLVQDSLVHDGYQKGIDAIVLCKD